MKRAAVFVAGATVCMLSGGLVVGGFFYLLYGGSPATAKMFTAGVGTGVGIAIGFLAYVLLAANATNLDNK